MYCCLRRALPCYDNYPNRIRLTANAVVRWHVSRCKRASFTRQDVPFYVAKDALLQRTESQAVTQGGPHGWPTVRATWRNRRKFYARKGTVNR